MLLVASSVAAETTSARRSDPSPAASARVSTRARTVRSRAMSKRMTSASSGAGSSWPAKTSRSGGRYVSLDAHPPCSQT
jgi:hypothetical protein